MRGISERDGDDGGALRDGVARDDVPRRRVGFVRVAVRYACAVDDVALARGGDG